MRSCSGEPRSRSAPAKCPSPGGTPTARPCPFPSPLAGVGAEGCDHALAWKGGAVGSPCRRAKYCCHSGETAAGLFRQRSYWSSTKTWFTPKSRSKSIGGGEDNESGGRKLRAGGGTGYRRTRTKTTPDRPCLPGVRRFRAVVEESG